MIRYLIKNNFKLMFRNTSSLILMTLGPILVIAILSSAFSELMKSYEVVDKFEVGYRAEEVSEIHGNVELLKEAGMEAGITFNKYPEGNPKDVIENNNLAGFVEFDKDKYVLYKSAEYEVEGIMLEYFLNRIMSESVKASFGIVYKTTDGVELPIEQIEFMPAIDSKDYYGIIYIVYFCWCGIICALSMLTSEKKYGLEGKFQVSNLSQFQMYMSKFVPLVLVVVLGIGIATILTILMFGTHWGSAPLSAILLFFIIVAACAFTLMIYNISDSIVITIIVLFTTVFFFGYVGGSFETYMYAAVPDIIKQISPIYHGNRALVELSCMGYSEYVRSSITFSLAITVVCSAVAIFAASIRKRGRA